MKSPSGKKTINKNLSAPFTNASLQPTWEDILAADHMRDDRWLLLDALDTSGGTGGFKI